VAPIQPPSKDRQWRRALDTFPAIARDESFRWELVDAIERYRGLLEKRDELFPKPFVLQDVLALLMPMVLSCSRREPAMDSYKRGAEAGNNGDYDLAIACYTEAIRLNPKFAHAHCNRGFAYGTRGELDRGIADYTQAILLDPGLAWAYADRGGGAYVITGKAYGNKDEYDRAITGVTATLILRGVGAGRIERAHDDGILQKAVRLGAEASHILSEQGRRGVATGANSDGHGENRQS